MKRSQLKQLIKEEIFKVLKENEFDSFLNSLGITLPPPHLDRGIDIGSDVAVIGLGPGIVIDVDEENKKYTVKTSKGEKKVPFNFVQPINPVHPTKTQNTTDPSLLERIKKLEKEHKQFVKVFVSNLAHFNGSNYREDFKSEQWKIPKIAEFYLDLGQQLWDMFKEDYNYITHSDEFEDLFLDILYMLKQFRKFDEGRYDELDTLVQSYEKIGDRLGAGTF